MNNFGAIANGIENEIITQSDKLKLNAIEKNGLHILKEYLSVELPRRQEGKKPGTRLLILSEDQRRILVDALRTFADESDLELIEILEALENRS